MNLTLGPELENFRSEVIQFLAEFSDCGAYFRHEGQHNTATRDLNSALGSKNWLALTWPKEVGGEAKPPLYEFVLWDEMAKARVARPPLGPGIVAKTIIAEGTPEQRDRFLPGLRSGTTFFSLGYSEPEAGSDLASLRTRAVRDGDFYVVTGEKRWTSGGHRADYLWTLCRTGTQEDRGRGLSILIIDRRSDGISISPIPAIDGERFNQVHFDEVRVPVANRIGPENGAWGIIAESLATERHVQFPPARVRRDFEDLVAWLIDQNLFSNPVVQHRLADLAVRVGEVEALALAMCEAVQESRDAALEAAANKLAGSEVCQEVARFAGDFGAPQSLIRGSEIEFLWRQSISETIGGGTSEIMLGLIATKSLGISSKG
ncbi:MAG: pilus assembly protein CpaD [Chloroflexi bacterium]|nr:pilus assembly protein CpaD [Chloroflexota bacterium]|tara:strand:+ start:10557 stop:11681 length:1125 start_codon:yes stop_codon:yes gene_type:complete